jgi:flagellin-like hook-associated protein FlgL
MPITGIGSDQALLQLNYTTNKLDLSGKLGKNKKINSPKEGPSGSVQASQGRSVLDDLQAFNAILNSVATSIKTADSTMGKIKTLIDRMIEQFGSIIKNYPPFPPGSEDREKFLRAFAALRRQIDQLSFTVKDEGASKIMADPALVPQAGDLKIVTGGNSSVTIHSQQVHTGPTGLDIPELPENATDKEIYAAIKNLDDARKTLGQRQSGLATDALSIQQFLDSNPKINKAAGIRVKAPKSPDMEEITAENKGFEPNQTLTFESIRSLTKDQSRLSELIK